MHGESVPIRRQAPNLKYIRFVAYNSACGQINKLQLDFTTRNFYQWFFLSVAAKYKETAIPRTVPSKCIFMQTVIFEKIHYLKKRKTSCALLRSDVLML